MLRVPRVQLILRLAPVLLRAVLVGLAVLVVLVWGRTENLYVC